MESCEKVFGNVDLLTLILEYLDFGDQLRFAQVNEQWRNAYEFCSENVNYSSLHTIRRSGKGQSSILIADETGINPRSLEDPQQLKDFLVVYADRVRDLKLGYVDKSLFDAFPRKFPNLRSLTTHSISFTRDIYDMCPANLQELKIIACPTDANAIVKVVRRMTNLNKLTIVCYGQEIDIDTRNLKVCELPKLEFLNFKTVACNPNVCLASARNLKELDIELWNAGHLKQLHLQHLKVLHLSMLEDAAQLLSILTESCAALETLTLKNVRFEDMTTCSLPPQVTHLSFFRCYGLTQSFLKQILTEFQIIKFCSRDTRYIGEFHDFKISSHIQSLEIDFVGMDNFRSAYENNSQIKELIWKPSEMNESYDGSFNSTPNLQLLEMQQMPAAGALSQLNSLKSLILTPHYVQPEWKDIVDLLKHPKLQELSFLYNSYTPLEEFHQPPLMSFHTNITRLSLTKSYFWKWIGYWLELFSTNMQLTLVCLNIEPHDLEIAKQLVNHKNFPRKLKTIDVCCFRIDCERLRRNFESVKCEYIGDLLSINSTYNYYDEDEDEVANPRFTNSNRIVLSWN